MMIQHTTGLGRGNGPPVVSLLWESGPIKDIPSTYAEGYNPPPKPASKKCIVI